MGFRHFLSKRSINMILVVFFTLVITIAILGSTIDKILIDSVRYDAVNAISQSKFHFQSLKERQSYVTTQIALNIKSLGLDEPWYSPKRFFNTLLRIVTLDLGRSNFFTTDSGSSSVRDIILERLPKTILLFSTSTLIVSVLGIYLGAFIADRSGSLIDKSNSLLAILSNSFPSWWIGMLMIFMFAFVYQIFPARSTPMSSPSDPFYIFDLLYHMLLPLITLVLVSFTAWAYIVRYYLIRIRHEDFIFSKKAIGISKRRILYSHMLKNAAPPIITSVALSLAASFGGAIIIESVFDWPGMGKLYYDAIAVNDVPIILGNTYIFSIIFVVTIFITDIAYGFFDPRVKVG
ncbi:MAG: ABC transporter permease [Nitrososphaeraceae archaeon]